MDNELGVNLEDIVKSLNGLSNVNMYSYIILAIILLGITGLRLVNTIFMRKYNNSRLSIENEKISSQNSTLETVRCEIPSKSKNKERDVHSE